MQAQDKKSVSYTGFYTNLHDLCAKVGLERGLAPQPCDNWIATCLAPVFDCLKKTDCSVSSGANPNLICSTDPFACSPTDLNALVNNFKNNSKCTSLPGNVSQAGCGNSIAEFHETCDDGNTQDGDTCPADCGVVFATEPAKCGDSKVDAGEECDAGANNGKGSSGCDVDCKKFPVTGTTGTGTGTGTTGTTGTDTTKDVTPNGAEASGSCSLHRMK
jgi:hypothetical protein